MSNLPSSADQRPKNVPENPEANFIYGTDVLALKIRLPSKRKIRMKAYIVEKTGGQNVGSIKEITNEGITDDIKIVEGNNKRLIRPDTPMFFTKEDFVSLGFDPKEAKIRQLPVIVIEEPEVENTGVRIRETSGAISRDITKVIGGEEQKAG
jgi:hypothetical protein